MGVCASSGGMFNNYAIVQGVDQIVPVDVYAPGCPPAPETLIHAITTLHRIIETGELMQRRAVTGQGAEVTIEQREAAPIVLKRAKRHLAAGETTPSGRR
jgi:NADH-quinone oxidoreductase subunit B